MDLDEDFEIRENITAVYSVLDPSNPFADALSDVGESYFRQHFIRCRKIF